jgi:hypothetical protein
MFAIYDKNLKTEDELVESLENAFKARYIPVLSELKLMPHEEFDYKENFFDIIKPLIKEELIELTVVEEKIFKLTEKGMKHFKKISKDFRYYDVKFSDSLLLKISEENETRN